VADPADPAGRRAALQPASAAPELPSQLQEYAVAGAPAPPGAPTPTVGAASSRRTTCAARKLPASF
jgi:hypothetical protein